ncbi:MAG: 3-dehydroquinate synthase [Candidatus Gracilibacteria bacterium]|nr:3-dehydroquinate synthase [Candidatus Gracilibacteria bacterium]
MPKLKINLDPFYTVYLGQDVFRKLKCQANLSVIITDTKVPKQHINLLKNSLKGKVEVVFIPAGEQNKNLATYNFVLQELLRLGADRQTVLWALGGGMVSDLTGFVAASYMRGIRFIQVPTTLLAAVDACISGKTGIDLPEAKNVVGAFWQPVAVYIDTSLLKTLSQKEFLNGLAEIIKVALLGDATLWRMLKKVTLKDLRSNEKVLQEIILRALLVKKNLIEQDERDQGKRQLLNFGHTVGHALETYFAYKKLSHGQAVAIGMMQELKLANPKLKDDLKKLLDKFSLPNDLPRNLNQKKLWELVQHDKKNKNGEMMMASIPKIGRARLKSFKLNDLKKCLK